MALHWPTFFTRLGSAVVFCAIMLTGLLWNEYAFLVLVSLIQVLCLREYFKLVQKITPSTYWPKWLSPAMQLSCMVSLWFDTPVLKPYLGILQIFMFFPPILLAVAFFSKPKSIEAASLALTGFFYIALPVLLLYQMRLVHFSIPLALILMLWTNDTMAYLVGSFIGKTPFSKISPKKTWEGTGGGAILTIAGAAVWGYYSPIYHMVDWMALALCAAVAGTAGDLLESKLKRMADVKDSGAMMPGHGGALDRFDSLLIATPFAFAYVYLFMM